MSTPIERTRAFRFAWEFLMELCDAANLTDEQRNTIKGILQHYPKGSEIKQWALDCARASGRLGPLASEDPDAISTRDPTIPDDIPRGPTTPEQRTRALLRAHEFFRFGILNADNLTTEKRRQIQFILRHYPEGRMINSWAQADAWQAKEDHAFKQWLEPESTP